MKNELIKRIVSSIILIPISFFFVFKGSIFFTLFLIFTFCVTTFEWLNLSRKLYSTKIFGIFFLTLSFFLVYSFRVDFGFNNFLFIILICIFTDVGGYSFGKILKGPKLTKISPNKTYSGVIGSFFISLIGTSIYLYYNEKIDTNIIDLNYYSIFIILIISLVSQIGDLIISYFKRSEKIKDTGKVLPGHGGIFDRIDGLMFVVIIATIYFQLQI